MGNSKLCNPLDMTSGGIHLSKNGPIIKSNDVDKVRQEQLFEVILSLFDVILSLFDVILGKVNCSEHLGRENTLADTDDGVFGLYLQQVSGPVSDMADALSLLSKRAVC